MKRKPYETYTKEFKLEAIRLMNTSDCPASEIAMQLGIRRNQLYKWKEQMSKSGDVPSPRRADQKKKTKVKRRNSDKKTNGSRRRMKS